jgi:hypothetical protein
MMKNRAKMWGTVDYSRRRSSSSSSSAAVSEDKEAKQTEDNEEMGKKPHDA